MVPFRGGEKAGGVKRLTGDLANKKILVERRFFERKTKREKNEVKENNDVVAVARGAQTYFFHFLSFIRRKCMAF